MIDSCWWDGPARWWMAEPECIDCKRGTWSTALGLAGPLHPVLIFPVKPGQTRFLTWFDRVLKYPIFRVNSDRTVGWFPVRSVGPADLVRV